VADSNRAETRRREWEIRRRVKGEEEWPLHAYLPGDTWWLNVEQALEYFRKERNSDQVEFAAFEIIETRVEIRRDW